MSTSIKISVVTPSFNQAEFLEATLRSIHDQEYPHLEHIVIDGGSTDGTLDVLRRWSDHLTYWVSEPDSGQTHALKKGFDTATGDVLCWLNSDDLFEPWTLREVARFFTENTAAQVVYGDATWIDVESRPIRPKREHGFNRFVFMYDHDFIPQPSTFWRRQVYEAVGGVDTQFDLAMDADLFIRFADITKIHHVRRPWSRMRFYPEQKNQRLRLESNREGGAIRARYLRPQPPWLISLKCSAARATRIGLKLATGCYTMTDLRWQARRIASS